MMSFDELRGFLLKSLTEDIVPFWLTHSVDWENGGLYSCIADDGTLLSRNKYMWSNARALWTFAGLVNRIESREEWRRAAENQYRFLKRCGRDEDGYWVFVVDEKGNIVEEENSIVTDAFAIYGLVEYFRMTGNEEALVIARETYETCRERLSIPGSYKTAPYPTPEGMKPHREAMQFSLMFCELGHELGDQEVLEEGLRYGREVLEVFYRPERDVLLEYVGLDNTAWDTPAGRAMVPGHGIESFWFQIHNFSRVGDTDRGKLAARALRCCFEKGWDPVHDGLLLGIDADGREPPYWKNWDKKIWWPFTEALPAALMAYELLREDWCLEWYWKCHDWAFDHFPDCEHGEWTQKLDRQGKRIDDLIALPVKDPFHLPRGLIIAIQTLERLTS